MHITSIHTLWREKQGFELNHNGDENHYVFIHFLSEAELHEHKTVHSGGCIFYKPHSMRYIKSENSPLIHDWFHAVGEIDVLARKYGLELGKIYYPENSSAISNIISEMEFEMLTEKPFFDDICTLKTEELIAMMARSSDTVGKSGIDSIMTENFVELRKYIHSNYFEIKNIEPLAKRVNLSVSRFYSLYKEIFGISPKQDLLSIRIEHAKMLLMQNRLSVSEISEMLGYGNQYHFIRQFKDFTGTTPGKYAKRFG